MARTHVTATSVGTNVRALMKRDGYNQTEVAQVLGTSQTGVSRRLLGHIPLDVNELGVLAILFKVPASRLLDGSHNHTETEQP